MWRSSSQSPYTFAIYGSTIPSSVLVVAPRLAKLSKHPDLDEHLQSTQKLRQAFSSEKAIEPIIERASHGPYPSLDLEEDHSG